LAKRLNEEAGDKYIQVQGKTYVFINRKETWENARTACRALGGGVDGDLASIPLYKDIDLISKKLSANTCKNMWVGLFWREDLAGTDNFKHNWFWLTGEPLPFNHGRWGNAAEPSTTANEKYGLLQIKSDSGKLWTLTNAGTAAGWSVCGFLCHILKP